MTRRRQHDLSGRLESLRDDLESLRKNLRGILDEASGPSAKKVHDAVSSVLESVEETADHIEGWAEDGVDRVRAEVRREPLTSLAVALGVGAILGALFLRR